MPYCHSRISYDDYVANPASDTPVLMRRVTAIKDCGRIPISSAKSALCLTVYNEPAAALWNSLAGLSTALENVNRAREPSTMNIAIIVDGLSQAAPSMLLGLAKVVGTNGFSKSSDYDAACYHRNVDLRQLAAYAREGNGLPASGSNVLIRDQSMLEKDETDDEVPHDTQVSILVVIKGENAGKLDSHWWFYRVFCPHWSPELCFQMDIGTRPCANALSDVIDEFDGNSSVGAVAASILPQQHRSFVNVLQCWQFFSFSNAMLLEWPAEQASGFLSVVPGQFSAFRWDSINDRPTITRSNTKDRPLDVYFRGLGNLTPAESMLYLAEDRILCRELVAERNAVWTISHVDQAIAETDSCDAWPELLRQRKRWCNGYVACRLSYLKGLPALLFDKGCSRKRKSRAMLAGVYHTLVLAHDWFTPAISYLLMFFLSISTIKLLDHYPLLQHVAQIGALCTFAAVSCQFAICLHGKLRPSSVRLLRIAIALQIWFIALALLINMLFAESKSPLYVFAFLLLVGPTAALLAHPQHVRPVFIHTPLALLAEYVVPPLLWTYAVCNAHDSSWGTKGLLDDIKHIRSTATRSSKDRDRFRTFKNGYLLAWLSMNLAAAAVFGLHFADNSSLAMTILLSIDACSLLFGLLCTAQKQFKPEKENACTEA